MSDFVEEIIKNSPKWVFRKAEENEVENFTKKTEYSRIVSSIFLAKDIRTEEDLQHYLCDDIFSLHNPFLFNHMMRTVARVRKAINEEEKIFIFGDRDVDGVLSTAMLYNLLKKFDASVYYKVPEGEYGYGIEKCDIDIARDTGVNLIITVDTGISSFQEVEYANSLNIETIILDHHVQPAKIPDAYSILNPKLEKENYPFKYLSAGSVVLKFIHGFITTYTKNFNRVFLILMPDDKKIKGLKVRNGLIEDYIEIKESINYPIKNNYVIVHDSRYELPEYLTQWLKEKKIERLSLINPKKYKSINEFADVFIKIFSKKQKKCINLVSSFIDLSAISTISDIMPLIGENRIIVKEGLKQIKKTANIGLKVLLNYCDLPNREIRAKDIAWNIAPIINSAGRMGDAKIAVDLFTTDDFREANDISKLLIELNLKRKEKGEKNLNIIKPIIENKYYKDPVIILSTDKAEHGVTGIIASKIAREFLKPAIIIVNDGKIGIGSGRGSKRFDLVSLISRCSDLLVKFGGHRSAVGFTIDTENIDLFRNRINNMVESEYTKCENQSVLEIDEVLSADDITFDLFNELMIFEPTGAENQKPKFSILNTSIINPIAIGKDKNHIKFAITSKFGIFDVIGWELADKSFRILEKSNYVDIVFTIDDNYFRGDKSLQLIMQDIRASRKRVYS